MGHSLLSDKLAQVVQRADKSLSSEDNVLVGEHFIHWIAISPLNRVILSLNNQGPGLHTSSLRQQTISLTYNYFQFIAFFFPRSKIETWQRHNIQPRKKTIIYSLFSFLKFTLFLLDSTSIKRTLISLQN